MFTLPQNLNTLDKRTLQNLASQAMQELIPSCGGDSIKADRMARATYPQLYAAIKQAVFPKPDTVSLRLSNAEAAAIPNMSPENIAALGLAKDASPEEVQTAWRAAGNRASLDSADDVYDALVDATAKSRGVSYQAAANNVRMRHTNLTKAADGLKAVKKLGATLPATTQGGDKRVNPVPGRGMAPLDMKSAAVGNSSALANSADDFQVEAGKPFVMLTMANSRECRVWPLSQYRPAT